jgi:DNA-directed RNA polymerase alpha subunit
MSREIIEAIEKIAYFALGSYYADGNESFKYIHNYLNQLKILIENPERKILELDISELGLSLRTINSLRADNINLIKELINFTSFDLLKIPNMAAKCINEIREALAIKNLKLKGD